jgi:hypothetical protein
VKVLSVVAEPKEGDEVITFTPLFVTLERYKIISLKDSSIIMDGFFSYEGARNFSAIWVKMKNWQCQGGRLAGRHNEGGGIV